MQKENASAKEVISYICAMSGGSIAALIPTFLWIIYAPVFILVIPLLLVTASIALYASENGYVKAVYFTFFVAALWAGCGLTVFVPIGFVRAESPVPVLIYLVNIGVGFVALFSAYFTSNKLKSLNKRLQPTSG